MGFLTISSLIRFFTKSFEPLFFILFDHNEWTAGWWQQQQEQQHQQSHSVLGGVVAPTSSNGFSPLSQLDENARAMLTLIQQQEGDSFAQRAEMYYQKRPELVKRLEGFRRSFNSLAEYFGQLSFRSSSSYCSLKQQENIHISDIDDAEKTKKKQKESPKSNPEEKDPLFEHNVNGLHRLGASEMYELNVVPTDNTSMEDDQSIVTMETETPRKLDGREPGWETAEDCDVRVGSLEHRISWSEQMSRHTQDVLNELVRSNEDKRAANLQLRNEMEKLVKEKHALQRQFDNVMEDNWALQWKFSRLRDEGRNLHNCPRCSTKNRNKRNGILPSRLKALFFGNHME